MAYLGKCYHAVSPDFWGTGQSSRLDRWPDDWFQQGAHDMAAPVAHLGAEKVIVIGTSGGAVVALWMGVLYPQRVQAIIANSEVADYPPDLLLASMRDRSAQAGAGYLLAGGTGG